MKNSNTRKEGFLMKNRLFAYTFLISLFLSSPAFAYKWCHDYTVHELTHGQVNLNESSAADLRKRLRQMGYKQKRYPAFTNWIIVGGKLAEGDVLIIGEGHSGLIKNGQLYNYTQEAVFKNNPKYNIPAKLHKDSSLAALMNKSTKGFEIKHETSNIELIFEIFGSETQETITPTTTYPYQDKPVEVWRKKIKPKVRHKKVHCRGPYEGEYLGGWKQDSNGCWNIPIERK